MKIKLGKIDVDKIEKGKGKPKKIQNSTAYGVMNGTDIDGKIVEIVSTIVIEF